jgi:hypothetical protein
MTDSADSTATNGFATGTVFHGSVELRHFADLNAATMKRLTGARTFDWLVLFAFMLVFAVATIALFKLADVNVVRRQRGQLIGGAEIAVIALLIGALLTDFLYRIFARAQNRRYHTSALREDGSFLGARTYTIGDDGMHVDGKYGTSLSRWQGFTDLSDEPLTVLLWADPCAAMMVPKDALGDAAAIDAFKVAVMAKIFERSKAP